MLSGTIAPQNKKIQLELIHHEVARIITWGGGQNCVSSKNSYLSWDGVLGKKEGLNTKIVIFYKIINGLTPAYLSDLLPPIVQDKVTYNLRNTNSMQSLRACTSPSSPQPFMPGMSYQMK